MFRKKLNTHCKYSCLWIDRYFNLRPVKNTFSKIMNVNLLDITYHLIWSSSFELTTIMMASDSSVWFRIAYEFLQTWVGNQGSHDLWQSRVPNYATRYLYFVSTNCRIIPIILESIAAESLKNFRNIAKSLVLCLCIREHGFAKGGSEFLINYNYYEKSVTEIVHIIFNIHMKRAKCSKRVIIVRPECVKPDNYHKLKSINGTRYSYESGCSSTSCYIWRDSFTWKST